MPSLTKLNVPCTGLQATGLSIRNPLTIAGNSHVVLVTDDRSCLPTTLGPGTAVPANARSRAWRGGFDRPNNAASETMRKSGNSIGLDRTTALIQGLERHVETPQPAQMLQRLCGFFGVQRPALVALML